MQIEGIIHNGVAVPDGVCPLPDGTKVRITAATKGEAATIWQQLRQIGTKYEQLPCDLPPDLSEHHDHYIHGTAKPT